MVKSFLCIETFWLAFTHNQITGHYRLILEKNVLTYFSRFPISSPPIFLFKITMWGQQEGSASTGVCPEVRSEVHPWDPDGRKQTQKLSSDLYMYIMVALSLCLSLSHAHTEFKTNFLFTISLSGYESYSSSVTLYLRLPFSV